jgi:hypothetical protein
MRPTKITLQKYGKLTLGFKLQPTKVDKDPGF